MPARKLGDVLVGHGYLSEEGRIAALRHAEEWSTPFGRACVELGLLSPTALWQALSLQLGANPIQLDGRDIDPAVLSLMPAALALKHRCVPVGVRADVGRGMLLLAVDGPRSLDAINEITFAVGRRVMLMIAPEDALERSLERCYPGRSIDLGRGPAPASVNARSASDGRDGMRGPGVSHVAAHPFDAAAATRAR